MNARTVELFPCSGPCGQNKPREAFYSHSTNKSGLQSKCIECEKQIARERREGSYDPQLDKELNSVLESLWKPTNA